MKGAASQEMEPKKPQTIVVQCIDFRKVEQARQFLSNEQDLQDGDYHLLSTAGAARNTQIIERLGHQTGNITSIIDLNHRDCGYAKKLGDDSQEAHQKSIDQLDNAVKKFDQAVDFRGEVLPIRAGDMEKHTCEATAIILGKPEIVKAAREELLALGLDDNHDEIARPFSLDVDDESLWEDLQISLNLHKPSKIIIFDESEENARALLGKMRHITQGIEIERRVVSLVA